MTIRMNHSIFEQYILPLVLGSVGNYKVNPAINVYVYIYIGIVFFSPSNLYRPRPAFFLLATQLVLVADKKAIHIYIYMDF